MSYAPADGMPGPPGPGQRQGGGPPPEMDYFNRIETRAWLPRTRERLAEYERLRRMRGLLG